MTKADLNRLGKLEKQVGSYRPSKRDRLWRKAVESMAKNERDRLDELLTKAHDGKELDPILLDDAELEEAIALIKKAEAWIDKQPD